ncbi:MAG: TauD/TfdA family dioxygenase [Amylibacter sp.]
MMDLQLPKTPITGPASWLGPDMAATPEIWLRYLTIDEIAELETAAKHFLALGKDVGEITKEDFPLPHLSHDINALREKLLNDVGVEVFRGLPTETYTQEFMATVFCGIGAHLGSARSQNAQGHILGHVRDIGADATDPNSRIYQTSERQTFHTDSADVVCLLCIRGAQEGGKSLLVSAMSIYNKMLTERPELLPYLFDPIATDRRGEIPEGAKPFMEIPVLNWFEGKLTVFYQRQYIDSAQRFPEAMRLTVKHIEALDLFDSYANDPDLNFAMQLQAGDIQFVYNHSQLHDRTGFLDWPDPKMRRHLFRLWISVEGDRPLPECFKERYGSIEIGKRGGIITKETKLVAPLD